MIINQITNKLFCGDCIEVMKQFPDNCIDLVVTSPPYNVGIDYDIYKDNLRWEDYLDWCKLWLLEIKRILKSDGRFAINILLDMGIENNKKRVSSFAEFYRIINEIGLVLN